MCRVRGNSPRRSCITVENDWKRSSRAPPGAPPISFQKLRYQLRYMCGYTSSGMPSWPSRAARPPPATMTLGCSLMALPLLCGDHLSRPDDVGDLRAQGEPVAQLGHAHEGGGGLARPALMGRQAGGGAQLEQPGVLLARGRDRALEGGRGGVGVGRVAGHQRPSLEAEELGLGEALAGLLDVLLAGSEQV